MTRTFSGKITGNNIRRDYGDYQNVKEFHASVVEFHQPGPFISTLVQFEVEGWFPIGSEVHFEMSLPEQID